MKFTYLLLLTASLVFTAASDVKRYDNVKIVRIPFSEKAMKATRDLHLDVWTVSHKKGIDVRVDSVQLLKLNQLLDTSSLTTQVLVKNLQKLIDQEAAFFSFTSAVTTDPNWHKSYHRFNDINNWLQKMAQTYSNTLSYTSSIGSTVEGRNMPLVKITGTKAGNKKRVWIQAQQHAREWIAGAVAQYVIDEFASKYNKDATITKLLDQVEFVIVPIANPDGYEYSATTDRMWRKTRGESSGVDPNRNWPDHWNSGGSSEDPEDETYMGESAGSAPEVQNLMNAFKATSDIIAAVDFHSFSQLILRPFGWTEQDSPDESAFVSLGDAINQQYNNDYTSEHVVDLYVASGGASDWFYGEGTDAGQQKNYGISIELPPRDVSEGGFVLPASQIVPVGKQTVKAIIAMTNYALAHPLGIK